MKYRIEEWRDIPGWEGYYQASSHGQIRSLERIIARKNGHRMTVPPKILSAPHNSYGRPVVGLTRNGNCVTKSLHRLIAAAFLGPCPGGMEVCHKTIGDEYYARIMKNAA